MAVAPLSSSSAASSFAQGAELFAVQERSAGAEPLEGGLPAAASHGAPR